VTIERVMEMEHVETFIEDRIPSTFYRPVPLSVGEVKSRDVKKFSKGEAMEFEKKLATVKKMENIERVVGFIFSRSGFTKWGGAPTLLARP